MIPQPVASEVALAASAIGTRAAWPSTDDEPMFAEPWEGRAFALAFDVVRRAGLSWEAFRQQLIAAIADDPHRPYYESWLVALERLTVEQLDLDTHELERRRADSASYRYRDDELGDIEVHPFAPARAHPDDFPSTIASELVECDHAELFRTLSDDHYGVRGYAGERQIAIVTLSPSEWESLIDKLF